MDTLRVQYDYLTSFGQAILAGNRPEAPSGVFPFGKQRQHISLYTPRSMQRQGVINQVNPLRRGWDGKLVNVAR